jgi:hypothetical protein
MTGKDSNPLVPAGLNMCVKGLPVLGDSVPSVSRYKESFERNLAQLYERADTPRLSGIQIKAPMPLSQGRAKTALRLKRMLPDVKGYRYRYSWGFATNSPQSETD